MLPNQALCTLFIGRTTVKYLAPLFAWLVAWPAAATELTIVGQEYPPFNWNSRGHLRGGMVDVMRAACERLHYTCNFQTFPLARAMKMLEMGEIDAVMSLIPNAERASFAHFSPALVVDNLGYFGVRGTATRVSGLHELAHWTIGGVRGSNSLRRARLNQAQVSDQTLVEEVNNETLVKKLQAGRYGEHGAIIGSEAVLRYEAQRIQLELEPVLALERQDFVTVFSKKRVPPETMDEVNRTLSAMKKSGETRDILQKYGLHAAP